MKKITQLLLSFMMVSIVGSCVQDDDLATVETATVTVSVYGAISREPRKGVKVVLYASESDVTAEENAIVTERTDSEGTVVFDDLALKTTYWARANTVLGINKTIRTFTTEEIDNELNLPVL
jgi:hypothetical protein